MPVITEKKCLCVEENFPYVLYLTRQGGHTKKELVVNNELELRNKNIVCVDFQNASSIKKINLDDNHLTQIDLSFLKDLEDLKINYNKLTNLDLSKNTKLKNVSCKVNRLKNIILSNYDIEIECYGNEFSREWTQQNKKDLLEIATKMIKTTKIKTLDDYDKCFNKAFKELCKKDKYFYGWSINDVLPNFGGYREEQVFNEYLIANVKNINEEYLKWIQMPERKR